MVSRLAEAIGSITDAIRLWERVGDLRGVAAAHDRGAIIEYYSARRREAEQHARLAVARGDTEAYGSACATQAYLAYRRHDHDAADAGSRLAREVAARTGDDAVGIRCDIIDDAQRPVAWHAQRKRSALMHAALALERSYDEVGTTAYSNLSAIDVEHRRFRDAEGVLARRSRSRWSATSPCATSGRRRCGRACTSSGLDGRRRWRTPTLSSTVSGMPLAMMWPFSCAGLVALRTARHGGEVRHRTPRCRLERRATARRAPGRTYPCCRRSPRDRG